MKRRIRFFCLVLALIMFLGTFEASFAAELEKEIQLEEQVKVLEKEPEEVSDLSQEQKSFKGHIQLGQGLVMAKNTLVKGTSQYFKLQDQVYPESLDLLFEKDGSESLTLSIKQDGFLDQGVFPVAFDQEGTYELRTMVLDGEEIQLDANTFEVATDPLSYFAKDSYPIVFDENLENGAEVGVRSLDNYLSKLSFLDEDLNYIDFDVEVLMGGGSKTFHVRKEAFSLATDLEPDYTFDLGPAKIIIRCGTIELEREIIFTEDEPVEEGSLELSESPNNWAVTRIAGSNRFRTAIEISKKSYYTSDKIVLVNGFNFPDALAAGPLALALKAPILFTSKDALDEDTLAEIERLKSSTIYIIGGESAVGKEVEESLKAKGLETIRKEGVDRFLTSVEVARELFNNKKADTAIICYFDNFPDALSISPYAAIESYPILFTEKEGLNQKTLDLLKEASHIKRVLVIGGYEVISDKVIRDLKEAGLEASRIAGDNRYQTSKEIALKFFGSSEKMLVASGDNFPDALAAGVYAGKEGIPLLVSEATNLNENIRSLLGHTYNSKYEMLELFPGTKYTTAKAPLGGEWLSKYRYVTFIGGDSALRNYLGSQAQRYLWKNWARLNKKDIKLSTTPHENTKDYSKITKEDLNKKTVKIPARKASLDSPIRIMLDPGHGWNYNAGAVSGFYEGNNNYEYAKILEEALKKYGFDVGISRTWTLDAERNYCNYNSLFSTDGITLAARGNMAEGYDLFISVHSNATGYGQASGWVRGTEIYDSVTTPNNELATKLGKTIASTFGHSFRGVNYRKDEYEKFGVVNDNWYGVLRNSKARHSMLVEHGYHDNYSDCKLFMTRSFQKTLAENVAKTLADYYGQY